METLCMFLFRQILDILYFEEIMDCAHTKIKADKEIMTHTGGIVHGDKASKTIHCHQYCIVKPNTALLSVTCLSLILLVI